MDDTSLIRAVKEVLEGRLENESQLIRALELSHLQSTVPAIRQVYKVYKRRYFDVKRRKEEVIKVLLSGGTIAKRKDVKTSLHMAAENGHTEIVEALLKFGTDPNSKDKNGRTALHIATQKGYLQIVAHLLKHGANVNSTYTSTFRKGYTPLHLAVIYNKREIVNVLIKTDANINAITESGLTALFIATIKGHKELVELLLKNGAKINFMFNTSLLHVAVTAGHSEIVELLLNYGADIDSKDQYGSTALHTAVENSYEEIIEVLLKFGADIDSKNKYGRTALSIASSGKFIEITKVLLKFGADIDSKDKFGRTELHYASLHGYSSFLTTLLEHGSDINVTCKNNLTPFDFALTCSNWGFENKTKVFKRHIIKMKTANLYVSKKNLLSINSDDEINYKDFQNECEEEITSMKSEKFNTVNVSFYDILTEDINQLAMYAGNVSIAHVLRSDNYKIKFPIYASMINNNFRKGERKREFNKIFYIFRSNFGLPQECTEKIFSYLRKHDLRNLFSAY